MADSDRQIDALLHQVDEAIAEHDLDADPRVIPQVARYGGAEMQGPEGHGRRDPKRAARFGGQLTSFALRFVELVQDPPTPLIVGAADVREMKSSRRALKEAHLERRLQRVEVPSSHCGCNPVPPRRRSKAASIHRGGEHSDTGQAIQGASLFDTHGIDSIDPS